jgi:hypothetical protein
MARVDGELAGGAGLGCPADIAMVQATDFGNLDDPAELRWLDWPSVGCILVEREVSARPVIVRKVAGQDAVQVAFAQNEDMIEALAPDRADESLREGILPRAVGRGQDFTDSHAFHSLPERGTVDAIVIAEEIGRRGVVREGVDDLLGGPGRGGMLGDVEVQDATPMVGEDDQDEEDAQARRGNGEEIDGDQISDMVGEERPPGLRRWGAPLGDQPGDGALGHVDAQLEQLAMDSGGAPEAIGGGHSRDQGARISALTGGRPAVGRPESVVQWSRKRRRCHRRTVSGATMTRTCASVPTPWTAQPRRVDRACLASAASRFSCTRRAAGAGRGFRGRVAGGRRRGTGRGEAGGAGG